MRSLLALSAWLVFADLITASAKAQPVVLKLSHFLGPTSFFELDFAQPWAKELVTNWARLFRSRSESSEELSNSPAALRNACCARNREAAAARLRRSNSNRECHTPAGRPEPSWIGANNMLACRALGACCGLRSMVLARP